MTISILGGLTAKQFIEHYWQKQPLLIRGAFPGFGDMLSPDELAGLACEETAQSRLVIQSGKRWLLEEGPFDEQRFSTLPAKDWTLLVQGVNHFLPEADSLLQAFDFIPRARLDDLMVSYAPDGGSVGPHFDSYDVFLLQGSGRRLWQISAQTDQELVPDAPLRILKHFRAEQEWLLEPGDMLYLPPRLAHWGIAAGDCMTWSIGFRAPSTQELATHFLGYLQERISLTGMYADPDLKQQPHTAEISTQMVGKVAAMLKGIAWDTGDVARFLGEYLTEPKPHLYFEAPRRISLDKFCEKLRRHAVALDLKSQLLLHGPLAFMNGESVEIDPPARPWLETLADRRSLDPQEGLPQWLSRSLHEWYCAGYLHFK